MMKLIWDGHYSVGIEPMDSQHQVIFDHMSAVSDALEKGEPLPEIREMLQKFDIYCKMHFFEEERLMDDIHYPALSGHRRQHDLYVANLEEFMTRKHQGLEDFLAIRDWFLSHIIQEDIPYGAFKKDHPVGG
jgi:hemerythrin